MSCESQTRRNDPHQRDNSVLAKVLDKYKLNMDLDEIHNCDIAGNNQLHPIFMIKCTFIKKLEYVMNCYVLIIAVNNMF